MFTGQAYAEMFARVLAPNLSGQRLPLSDQQQAQTTRSELLDRMNRPVLPRFLSVFDDPTAQRVGNQELLGHYQVDDQGVPARRVSLIEQGVLKNFLMSRRPGKDMPQSNGHGRSVVPGRETARSEEHTSELQSLAYLVCRLLLEKKKKKKGSTHTTTTINY